MTVDKYARDLILYWFSDGASISEISDLIDLDIDLIEQIVEESFNEN